jgi:hypothetical protein
MDEQGRRGKAVFHVSSSNKRLELDLVSRPPISAQGETTGSGIDPTSGIGPLGTRLLYEFAS